jgi:hypothetical protein
MHDFDGISKLGLSSLLLLLADAEACQWMLVHVQSQHVDMAMLAPEGSNCCTVTQAF